MPKNTEEIIARVCDALLNENLDLASMILAQEHPFCRPIPVKRKCSNYEKLRVWARDGFIDRYTGAKLVSPLFSG